MYGYIYETTNLVNGKKYIGQKKSEVFLAEKYLGSGKILRQAVKKYGVDKFKVKLVEKCDSQEELDEKEKYYISKLSNNYPINMIYNIASGGNSGNLRKFYTEEQYNEWKYKISKSKKGQKPWNAGHKNAFSDTARIKMSMAHKGKKLSDEHKRKISNSNKISQNRVANIQANSKRTKELWQDLNFRNKVINSIKNTYSNKEIREKLSMAHRGKKLSDEHKRKISNTLLENGSWIKGKHHTKETRDKISKASKGRAPYCKDRIAINDGVKRKYVNKEDLQMYLDKGFKIGYPSKKGDD